MAARQVAVVTDSTAFLPQHLLDRYDIASVPQTVHWGEEDFLDGVEMTPAQFYERLRQSRELPRTSQPPPGRFLEYFKRAAENSDSIVAVVQSTELSGTYASAVAAAREMEGFPITVVDSLSTSMGCGLITLAAARAADAGHTMEEVAAVAQKLVPHVHLIFVLDTLEYLHRGGRIGGAQRLLGSLLSVKPLLHLDGGRVEPLASPRTRRKAIRQMLDVVAAETADAAGLRMAIVHAAAPEEAAQLAAEVEAQFHPVELIHTELSPVVGTHAGPGALGLIYYDIGILGEEAPTG